MPVAHRSKALTLFWRLHRWFFRVSDGRLGASILGNPTLRLVTTGRRSHRPREVMLQYFRVPSGLVVVASNAGADTHPAWYLNLRAAPTGEIQIGRERWRVEAREARSEERARLWSEIIKRDQSYAQYEARTNREIPVLVLEAIDPMSD